MKWTTKIPPTHQLGDVRVLRRFALWPKKLDDGFTVWLHGYNLHQKFWPLNGGFEIDAELETLKQTIRDFEEEGWHGELTMGWVNERTSSHT